MSTLRQQLDLLLDLQKLHTEQDRLKRVLAALDDGAVLVKRVSDANLALETAQAAMHKTNADLKDAELELQSVEKKRTDYEKKMNGSFTNPREIQNIEKEINQLTKRRSVLDDKILEAMDESDRRRQEVAHAEATRSQLQEELKTQRDAHQYKSERLNVQIGELNRRIGHMELQVEDKALLKRYETIRGRAAGLAIAKVDGNSCGSCHMQIGSMDSARATDGQQVVICENCGRIMC